ncbi:hypothetical protein RFI_32701 [Reticulomyxa filosa]|uniref:MIT domain-containing protein n=1 Tax=Reticulomyxa filosa TaxID=46433 RepID=X6LVD6_RETFI|nr:hypothetical protein RFI_32701 [Reticulomyxa filosa]|eukprot:ETO04695.1 hypothetical protein RFI_32701 [Reticulomyxa filosa]
MAQNSSNENISLAKATEILNRAIIKDNNVNYFQKKHTSNGSKKQTQQQQYEEALVLYKEGLQSLFVAKKAEKDQAVAKEIGKQLQQHLTRAEQIKEEISVKHEKPDRWHIGKCFYLNI